MESSFGGSGKQVAKHSRLRRKGGIAASQEVIVNFPDISAHGAVASDDLSFDAEMRANISSEKTKSKIALGRASLTLLPSALKWLMHHREGRIRIKLMHDVLDTGVERRRDLVLKMRIVFPYLEAVAFAQSIIPLPNIVEHDVDGIGLQTLRKFHKILGDGVIPLKGRVAISQGAPPRRTPRGYRASLCPQRCHRRPLRPQSESNNEAGWA